MHISLGIFCKLFSLFEKACQQLELKILKMAEHKKEQRERQLQCAAQLEEKASFLEEKLELYVQNLTWNCLADDENEDSEKVKSLQVAIFDYQKKIKKWVIIKCIDY